MKTLIEKKIQHLAKEGDLLFDEGSPFGPPSEDFRVLTKESGKVILDNLRGQGKSKGVFSIGDKNSLLGFSEDGKLALKEDQKFIDGLNFEGGVFFQQKDITLKEYATFSHFLDQHWEKLSIIHNKQALTPALFLDRDGVINEDCGYPSNVGQIKIIPEIAPMIKMANDKGYPVVVVTNQSGLARNYLTQKELNNIHAYMSEELLKLGAKIDDYLFCPFHPKGENDAFSKSSYFRKPGPLMALEGGERHHVDFERSVMIGDKFSDVLHAISLKTFVLKSKYSKGKSVPDGVELVENHTELNQKVKSFFSLL